MLVEIKCDKFKKNAGDNRCISFHSGLNTVLGTDSGTNSIGKSTFLMIIDYVFGGDDYLDKLTDVQEEVKEHTICFCFEFKNKRYYFSRSNKDRNHVQKCNSKYEPIDNGLISTSQYTSFLQEQYGMELPGLTFRNAVGRSMRIFKRENLRDEHPLHQAAQESAKAAIYGLLKLVDLYSDIDKKTKAADLAKDKLKTFKSAQKYQYIPSITKQADYDSNQNKIEQLKLKAEELASKSTCGFVDLDSLQAEQVSNLQNKLSALKRQRSSTSSQLRAIQADQELGKKRFKRSYDDLARFFPEVDLQRIEDIESFHKQLTGILKQEFSDTEEHLQKTIAFLNNEIKQTEDAISEIAKKTDLSRVVLEEYASIDKELKLLEAANKNFITSSQLEEDSKNNQADLDKLIVEKIAQLQLKINNEMKSINDEIYDGKKTAPILHVADSSHYTFITPRDGGTGSQYKGLIVFDLAMLSLTCLPAIAHDSILLKQIEDDALEKILNIYSQSPKQVFIAIDKVSSYTPKAQKIMKESSILQLGPKEEALFGCTWNEIIDQTPNN